MNKLEDSKEQSYLREHLSQCLPCCVSWNMDDPGPWNAMNDTVRSYNDAVVLVPKPNGRGIRIWGASCQSKSEKEREKNHAAGAVDSGAKRRSRLEVCMCNKGLPLAIQRPFIRIPVLRLQQIMVLVRPNTLTPVTEMCHEASRNNFLTMDSSTLVCVCNQWRSTSPICEYGERKACFSSNPLHAN